MSLENLLDAMLENDCEFCEYDPAQCFNQGYCELVIDERVKCENCKKQTCDECLDD